MSKIRIDKLLSNLGYGSRKDVAAAVKRGVFYIDDKPYRDPSVQVPIKDLHLATYDHVKLDPVAPLTIIFNKPKNYTCSHDEQGLLIYDLLPERWKYRTPPLSAAGRLDKDSTGLVLMTDDGQLLHKIISPKVHVSKYYRVTLRDELKGNETEEFFSGLFCLANDPKPLKPAVWQADGPRSGIMILQEGRYRQIRRMFGALGNHVEELHRFRIGGLEIGDMKEGEYRILNTDKKIIFGETP